MKWGTRLAQEALVAAALGSAPLLIAYIFGGAELTVKVLAALLPERAVVWYLAGLIVPYALVVFCDRFFLKRTDRQRRIMKFLRSTWREIGTALHALWRVLAGALLTLPFLYLADPGNPPLSDVATYIWVGGLMLAECWLFSFGWSFLEPEKR
ncbi:MAG: hypothetical protein A2180_04270 [Pseudomonadales bacterium GWC2_63_15]|nr:MAG: hypothetical protein A2180_04270 [Pseudomonadales bacterium GWC2_63_15]